MSEFLEGVYLLTISEAKKRFGARYRSEEGFVGVGIGSAANSEALRVYAGADSPIAQKLKRIDF